MKSGFVSIIGRPNVGKSTLINALVGHKVAIVSNKPQTTRHNIQGIYNEEDCQIVFVDTPGIHKPHHKLGVRLNDQAYFSIDDVDIVLYMVDITESLGSGDLFVIEKLKEINKPVFLLLNKTDKIKKTEIFEKIDEYNKLYDFKEIIPLSALKKDNVQPVIKTLKKYLPDAIKYYEDEELTDTTVEFRIAEIIREKVLELTGEEVPHTVTCLVEEYKELKNKTEISAVIIVERDSIKGIIIGKQGALIKEIGTRARKDIEVMLDKKVYLSLFVKTVKKWRDTEKYLREFGFYNN